MAVLPATLAMRIFDDISFPEISVIKELNNTIFLAVNQKAITLKITTICWTLFIYRVYYILPMYDSSGF